MAQALRTCIMRAIRVHQFGAPEVMKLETNVPLPLVADDEVLIKVHAIGVNPVDTYIRSGAYARRPSLPYTPGDNAAGVVEAIGSSVKKLKVGDHVYTVLTQSGSYAEYTAAKESMVVHLHDNLTFSQGAGIGTPYYTAYKALFLSSNSKPSPGQTVFIHGASGGVGLASVQLCKAFGLRVIGTAGSQGSMDLVKNIGGADMVFNHKTEHYIEKVKSATSTDGGPDIILEMLANLNLEHDLDLIKIKGKIVVIGSRGSIEMTPRLLMTKAPNLTGIALQKSTFEEFQEMHYFMEAGMRIGWLKPHVGQELLLEEAAMAHHEILQTKSARGKIILKP